MNTDVSQCFEALLNSLAFFYAQHVLRDIFICGMILFPYARPLTVSFEYRFLLMCRFNL